MARDFEWEESSLLKPDKGADSLSLASEVDTLLLFELA